MKLTENQYNELLNLSHTYFKTLDSNPVNALLLDLISKEKSNQPVKVSNRLKDYWTRKKNRFEILTTKSTKKDNNTTKEKIDFLFFISEPTHYNQAIGILKVLKKEKRSFLVVTNKIKIFKQFQKESINVNLIPDTVEYTQKDYSAFNQNIDSYIKQVDSDKILTESDSKRFLNVLEKSSLPFYKYLEYFTSLVSKFNPGIVIIGNDLSFFGRILASICNERKINSIAIQHGTIPFDPIHKYHLANKLYVFGKKSQEVLLSLGIEKEKIQITGAPYLDAKLFDKNTRKADKLLKYFKLKSTDKIALVALSGAGQRTSLKHHKKLIETINILAGNFSQYKFLIKLHRKDDIKFYSDLKKFSKNIVVKRKIKPAISNDIFDWLKISEVLITGNSAVATEAMLMKKPVLTIDLMNEYPFMDFIQEKASLHSENVDDTIKNFSKTINDKKFLESQLSNQTDFINKYFYNSDGNTSARCVKLIEQLERKI